MHLPLLALLLVPSASAPAPPPAGPPDARLAPAAEDAWVYLYDQPSHHVFLAREALQKGRTRVAADEIVLAASYLRMRGRSAQLVEGQQSLADAALRLERLARRVQDGDEPSVLALDRAAARAETALAKEALLRNGKEVLADHPSEAGRSLEAAAFHLQHGFAWAGHPLAALEANGVAQAALYGQELVDGVALEPAREEELSQLLGAQLVRLEELLAADDDGAAPLASVGEATSDWMEVGSDAWVLLIDESLHHEHLAREHLLDGERAPAANELRKVAAWLTVEAEPAQDEPRSALESSARELSALARGVEAGAVLSVEPLQGAFARAEDAFARSQEVLAAAAWREEDTRRTAHHLRSALRHCEHALVWAGRESEEQALAGVELLTTKLLDGSKPDPAEVESGLAALEKVIDGLDHRVAST